MKIIGIMKMMKMIMFSEKSNKMQTKHPSKQKNSEAYRTLSLCFFCIYASLKEIFKRDTKKLI